MRGHRGTFVLQVVRTQTKRTQNTAQHIMDTPCLPIRLYLHDPPERSHDHQIRGELTGAAGAEKDQTPFTGLQILNNSLT